MKRSNPAFLLIALFLSFSPESINAQNQWVKTGPLYGGDIVGIATLGNLVFAGSNSAGVFVSNDKGQNWTEVNNGLVDQYGDPFPTIREVYSFGNSIYAGVYGGLFRTTDNGLHWNKIDNSYPIYASCIFNLGTILFACQPTAGISRSKDSGKTWIRVNTGLTNKNVNALAAVGTQLFAGTESGVFKSSDSGNSWIEASTGLSYATISSFATIGTTLFAGANYGGGIFVSSDFGSTWAPLSGEIAKKSVLTLVVNGSTLFAGTSNGVYLSTNSGATWTRSVTGLTNLIIKSLAINGTDLYVGTYGSGVFYSSNNGINWTPVNNGIIIFSTQALVTNGKDLILGTYGGGVFVSPDSGITWKISNFGLFYPYFQSLFINKTGLLAGTDGGGVYISKDTAKTWNYYFSRLDNGPPTVYDFAMHDSTLFAGSAGNTMSVVIPPYDKWVERFRLPYNRVFAMAFLDSLLFINTSGSGVVKSLDYGQYNWSVVLPYSNSYNYGTLEAKDKYLFASLGTSEMQRSADTGKTWVQCNNGLGAWPDIQTLKSSGKYLFAGTYNQGAFFSTNNGDNWYPLKQGMTDSTIYSFEVLGNTVYAAAGNSVWKRTLPEPSSIKSSAPLNMFSSQITLKPFTISTTQTIISFSLPKPGLAKLTLYSSNGRKIAAIAMGEFNAGINRITWNTKNIKPGAYVCSLESPGANTVRKIILP